MSVDCHGPERSLEVNLTKSRWCTALLSSLHSRSRKRTHPTVDTKSVFMQSSFLPYVVDDKLLVHDNHVAVANTCQQKSGWFCFFGRSFAG
jgi:hypothetical protein